MPRLRGALPAPRHRLAAATPHSIVGETPPTALWLPAHLSFWNNDQFGCCVTTEEAFNKDCGGVWISDETVRAFAAANGLLNGAYLPDVLQLMQTSGFQQDERVYGDGPYHSVDWTNRAILTNAIAQGPVKIGVAADQLESAVPQPPRNGWLARGFQADHNEDHCVSLCGYGPAGWLLEQLGASGSDNEFAYAMFTWKSVGVIDEESLLAICGEAWLRIPGTVIR